MRKIPSWVELVSCPECEGEGGSQEYCMFCNGSGEGMYDGAICRECRGHGEVAVPCSRCEGRGTVDKDTLTEGELEEFTKCE